MYRRELLALNDLLKFELRTDDLKIMGPSLGRDTAGYGEQLKGLPVKCLPSTIGNVESHEECFGALSFRSCST